MHVSINACFQSHKIGRKIKHLNIKGKIETRDLQIIALEKYVCGNVYFYVFSKLVYNFIIIGQKVKK